MNKKIKTSIVGMIILTVWFIIQSLSPSMASATNYDHEDFDNEVCFEDHVQEKINKETRERTGNTSEWSEWADWPGAGPVWDDGRSREGHHGGHHDHKNKWDRDYRYVVVDTRVIQKKVECPPPTTVPPTTVPPTTEPPVTVPPTTEPPVTVPPTTEPPATTTTVDVGPPPTVEPTTTTTEVVCEEGQFPGINEDDPDCLDEDPCVEGGFTYYHMTKCGPTTTEPTPTSAERVTTTDVTPQPTVQMLPSTGPNDIVVILIGVASLCVILGLLLSRFGKR